MSSVKLSEERFTQPTTLCPEGHYFRCDRYGACYCRKNMMDWFNNLSSGAKIGIIVAASVVGIIVIILIIFGIFTGVRWYGGSSYSTGNPLYGGPGYGGIGYGGIGPGFF
jgi:hypothetical protein